jgi:hypothetical protein
MQQLECSASRWALVCWHRCDAHPPTRADLLSKLIQAQAGKVPPHRQAERLLLRWLSFDAAARTLGERVGARLLAPMRCPPADSRRPFEQTHPSPSRQKAPPRRQAERNAASVAEHRCSSLSARRAGGRSSVGASTLLARRLAPTICAISSTSTRLQQHRRQSGA